MRHTTTGGGGLEMERWAFFFLMFCLIAFVFAYKLLSANVMMVFLGLL